VVKKILLISLIAAFCLPTAASQAKHTKKLRAPQLRVIDKLPVFAGNTLLLMSARRHHRHRAGHRDANGNVVSHKTSARATVGAAHAAKFQAYIDDLESRGARVIFMGGVRRGHCSSGSKHPCGMALDVCQLRRGVVDRRCNLPDRKEIASIAASHGLFEGGQWCSSDYGHAQVGVSAPACGTTMIARRHTHRRHYASRRHHRIAYAQQQYYYPHW